MQSTTAQPRVIAILVARSGTDDLEETLAALHAQTRAPDVMIAVDISKGVDGPSRFAALDATHVLSARDGTTFGKAISQAVHQSGEVETESEWFWLLSHDSAPAPDALASLLAAVEIAPSVGIAGPKLMQKTDPSRISELGQTISRFGATVSLVNDELDQEQYDTRDDVLGVSASGMLVRRTLWSTLGGFDPGLPNIDAALDFSIRARLFGYRVIVVPEARVSSVGGPELFDRATSSPSRTFRLARTAQLHRRLVYSPAWALVFHWLSLVPLAVLRSLGDLIAKHPGAISGEISAAFAAAFTPGVGAARRNLRRSRRLGWAAIAPLRMPTSEVRERRLQAREAELIDADGGSARAFDHSDTRASFIANGGLWIVALVGVVGILAYSALLGASALSGGGLRPITHTVSELWENIGLGWRHVGTGMFGAADPFAIVLAILGSLTWWAPSLSIVLIYVLALPLAALGAWFAARRFCRNPWMPALAAVLWAFSPPMLAAISEGRLGALIAHLLLPWLVMAAVGASRSWAAGAAAAILFAAIAASAPSLVPALLVLFVFLLASRPTKILRIIGMPIPALVLFAPLIVQQVLRANPLGLLADPGVPVAGGMASGWQLALGDPTGSLHGWYAVVSQLTGSAAPALMVPIMVSALLAPLGVMALLALFLPKTARAVPMLVVAFLGYSTAVFSQLVQVGAVGPDPVTVWAGSGLSLMWLGIIGAAVLAIEALGRVAGPVSVLAGLTTVALAIPLLGAFILGTAAVHPSNGRVLPALVGAQAAESPTIGTLVITSHQDAGISVRMERGVGASLDDQSTLVSTTREATDTDARLAVLAGNLATRSGFDYAAELQSLGVSFIVVANNVVSDGAEGDEMRESAVQSLDGNGAITPVGTTATGQLWRFDGTTDAPNTQVTTLEQNLASWYLLALAIIFGATALLAIPIGGRPRKPRPSAPAEEPAGTFEEDDLG